MSAQEKKESPSLVVRCCICTQPLNESRKRRRSSVCSESCKDRLDYINEQLRQNTRCTHCLAPSTPEERIDFRAWRAQRKSGDRVALVEATKALRDRTLANKKDLVRALATSTRFLEKEIEMLLKGNAIDGNPTTITDLAAAKDYQRLSQQISANKQLLDKKPAA